MALNEKLRTPDFVEVLDVKIKTTSAHPNISVVPGEPYDDVLDKLETQVLTPDQKAALDAAISTPSSTNPVVLKDDIPTYYPDQDLGEIRDAVDDLTDLPLSVNPTGDTTLGDTTIINVSSMAEVVPGQTVSGPGIPAGAVILSVGVSDFTMNIAATATAAGVSLIIEPGLGDLRPVLNENEIHRWDGLAWNPFLSTGTLDHTQLINENGDTNFLHITLAEKTGFLTGDHTHSNKAELDLITSAGSGIIISTAERNRLPTADEKDALQGTQGVPSGVNRYVTNSDPRLNTLRNPFVTVGNDIAASYPGSTVSSFLEAIRGISKFDCIISQSAPVLVTGNHVYSDGELVFFETDGTLPDPLVPFTGYYVRNATPIDFNISVLPAGPLIDTTSAGSGNHTVGGNNRQSKAIEILAQNFIYTSSVRWEYQNDGLLIESLTPFATTIKWQTFQYAVEVLLPGEGAVTVRGIVFELDGANTSGFDLKRDGCLIEDCIFTGLGSLADNHEALKLDANNITIRRCQFLDHLTTAVQVMGDNCRIEQCVFSLSSNSAVALDIFAVSGTKISFCKFNNCTIQIQSGVEFTELQGNFLESNVVYSDLGSATRFIDLPSSAATFGQAFVGKRRTLGPADSFADYRGDTDAVFTSALADPEVTDLFVFGGTYTFSSTVTIPDGKRIFGIEQSVAAIIGTPGIPLFQVSSSSSLENMDLTATAAPVISIPSVSNVVIRRCTINLSGPDTTDDFGVYCTGSQDVLISDCLFSGIRGVSLLGGSWIRLIHNEFITSGDSLYSDALLSYSQIKDNHVLSGVVDLNGNDLIVEGNHFVLGAPSKAGTVNSVWQNNYPHPEANNFAGIDYLRIPLAGYLRSRSPGCQAGKVLGAGALAFLKAGDAHSISLPIRLGGELDTTFGFDVVLKWTSYATAGDVYWRVKVTFRVEGTLGTSQVQTAVSNRTFMAIQKEETVTLSFPAVYGLVPAPTSVAVEVSRMALDPLDTLPAEVYLIDPKIILKRK